MNIEQHRRRIGIRGCAVGAILTCLVTSSSRVSAEEPRTSGQESVVVVEVDPSLDRAEQLRARILADAQAVLEEHDVPLGIDPEAPRKLTIDVGGERYDYRVELVVERDGRSSEPKRLACECNYDELFGKVRDGVATVLPELTASSSNVGARDNSPSTSGPATPPPADLPRRAPLGPMGKAGIATLVVGAAGLATGIALVAIGKRDDSSDRPEGEAAGTDFRPPGYAVLAVGGAALVTGAVLLAVDRSRARKRATTATPWLAPRFAGFVLITRF